MSVPVPPEWRELMRAGFYMCHYCFAVATTFDHIVPKCVGGSNYPWNFQPACYDCNRLKDTKMPTCVCRRCQRALNRWRRRLPEERRHQLVEGLTAQIHTLNVRLAALAR